MINDCQLTMEQQVLQGGANPGEGSIFNPKTAA
jgi:hypothetical protein